MILVTLVSGLSIECVLTEEQIKCVFDNNSDIILSTHNIGFYEEMKKIIFQLLSDMHFICSSMLSLLHHFID